MFALFRALPISGQIGSVLAIGAALWGGWFAFKTHYYNKGWNAHALAVEMQDASAVEASTLARQTIAKCRDAGGEWDAAGGVCDHGAGKR